MGAVFYGKIFKIKCLKVLEITKNIFYNQIQSLIDGSVSTKGYRSRFSHACRRAGKRPAEKGKAKRGGAGTWAAGVAEPGTPGENRADRDQEETT